MAYPKDIPIVETFVGMPSRNRKEVYKFLAPHLRDEGSKEMRFPAQYMFKDVPGDLDESVDPVALLIDNLDRYNIEVAMLGLGLNDINPDSARAIEEHPDRFVTCVEFDPNDTMAAIRKIRDMVERFPVRGVSTFPAGYRVPLNDKKMYPLYALCVELDLPIFVCVGIPGPRVPFAPQHVELIDEVMYDFPELTFVMRHGAQPWTELAMKLMLKWPNLYYSTSAFAPKHYDKVIIDYANTRGADKIIYAGYFPAGLSYERIFNDMENVPFKDHVWPKFLRENALKVLKLG
ncbi:amidohydrolase family protein [Rhabdothermincola salaria]|uniref:amidohydrolase family protein n=1 Tax=Rhabdothermincola salaria TaxID=2903142 RepID=UPI001E460EE5|nr:amidohydrolase family protein [Rhabdothermincola salaria]